MGAPGTLLTTTALNVGDTNCPAGGLRVDAGPDRNGNGVLDGTPPSEIVETRFLCNGGSGRLGDVLFPYDSFAGGFGSMSRDRWQDLEFERVIDGVALRLSSHSEQGPFNSGVLVPVGSANSANSAEATLQLTESTVYTTNAFVAAKIEGVYFNDTSMAPADRVGDVFAYVAVQSGSATGNVLRCTNANCSTNTGLAFTTLTLPPGWNAFQQHTYRIVYDGNVGFTYAIDGVAAGSLTAPTTRIGSPRQQERRLMAQVGNGSGRVSVLFHDVTFDGMLYDDFVTGDGRLDPTKWTGPTDAVRMPRNGRLYMQGRSVGPVNSFNTRFTNPDSHRALTADVTVLEHTQTGTGYGRARLGGFFFNDGTVGNAAGSNVGDIFAEVSMNGTEASFLAARCTNVDCSTSVNITNVAGNGRISLGAATAGTTYPLYVAWDGARFTAQLGNRAPLVFDPVAAGAPIARPFAQAPFMTLGLRHRPNAGEEAFTRAYFDSVRTGGPLIP